MHRYIKATIKACEKASGNIRRDLNEVLHLQTSRNLKGFLQSSQLRFEKNIANELTSETINIFICNRDGEHKNIIGYEVQKRDFRTNNSYCFVVGIDNMINLAHGIEHVGFSILFSSESNAENMDNIISAAICIPASNTIVYSDNIEETYLFGIDGYNRRLKVNSTVNISLPSVLCAADGIHHELTKYSVKRDIHFVSTGSILCDAVRVLKNKIDIAWHTIPNNLEYLSAIRRLIYAAGGADAFVDNAYVFGKKAIVQSIVNKI